MKNKIWNAKDNREPLMQQSFVLFPYVKTVKMLKIVPGPLLIQTSLSIKGGLTAVIWTDFIQTIIMLVGATVLMIRSKHFTHLHGQCKLASPHYHVIFIISAFNCITRLYEEKAAFDNTNCYSIRA